LPNAISGPVAGGVQADLKHHCQYEHDEHGNELQSTHGPEVIAELVAATHRDVEMIGGGADRKRRGETRTASK